MIGGDGGGGKLILVHGLLRVGVEVGLAVAGWVWAVRGCGGGVVGVVVAACCTSCWPVIGGARRARPTRVGAG